MLGVKRESRAGRSCDRLRVTTRSQTPKTERGGPPGCAPNLEPPLCASLPHAAGRSQVGLVGTCTEQRSTEPRRPGAHAEEERRLRESRAGPPRTRPRSRARTCWKGGDNGESLVPPRPLREGGARVGVRAGRPLSPQTEPGPARLALSRPPPPLPARPPAIAAFGKDPKISTAGAKLMGGVCSHPSKSGACLQSRAERKDHPAAGGEVAKKGKAPGRLGQRRGVRTQTRAAQQPWKQGTPSRVEKGTPPKHARLLGEAGQRKETGREGW